MRLTSVRSRSPGGRLKSEDVNGSLAKEITSQMSGSKWRISEKHLPTSESCSPTNATARRQSVNVSDCNAWKTGRTVEKPAPSGIRPTSIARLPKPNGVSAPANYRCKSSGVRGKKRLIAQAGGELIDIERLVEARVQLLRVDQ